jgi:hypothetical protein
MNTDKKKDKRRRGLCRFSGMEREALNLLSERVIGAVFEVANSLGLAFWRKFVRKRCFGTRAPGDPGRFRSLRFLLCTRVIASENILPTFWLEMHL